MLGRWVPTHVEVVVLVIVVVVVGIMLVAFSGRSLEVKRVG